MSENCTDAKFHLVDGVLQLLQVALRRRRRPLGAHARRTWRAHHAAGSAGRHRSADGRRGPGGPRMRGRLLRTRTGSGRGSRRWARGTRGTLGWGLWSRGPWRPTHLRRALVGLRRWRPLALHRLWRALRRPRRRPLWRGVGLGCRHVGGGLVLDEDGHGGVGEDALALDGRRKKQADKFCQISSTEISQNRENST